MKTLFICLTIILGFASILWAIDNLVIHRDHGVFTFSIEPLQ